MVRGHSLARSLATIYPKWNQHNGYLKLSDRVQVFANHDMPKGGAVFVVTVLLLLFGVAGLSSDV